MLANYFEIETKIKGCIFKDCVNFLYEIFPNGSWRFDRAKGRGLAQEQIPEETSWSWRAVQADRNRERRGYY